MSYLIAAMFVIAVAHLMFESIIAPSIRMKLRFDLFSLRDELRQLEVEGGVGLDDRQFDCLQASLNALIAILHRFDCATLVAIEYELRRNALLRVQTDARVRLLDGCTNRFARDIRARSVRIAAAALAVNSGGWFIYILPLALPVIGYSKLRRLIRESLALSESGLARITAFSGTRVAAGAGR